MNNRSVIFLKSFYFILIITDVDVMNEKSKFFGLTSIFIEIISDIIIK